MSQTPKPPRPPTSTSASPHPYPEQELGLPSEWHSRGYLPHRDRLGLIHSITFRLADSLPATLLAAFEEELRSLPAEQQHLARRKQIEQWLDAGMGCCALRRPEVAKCVEDALLLFDGK